MPVSTRTPGPFGSTKRMHLARSRQEAVGRVLGVEAALDGMAALAQVSLPERQLLARSDPDLPLRQVQADDHLGDGVLDLEPGVHLEEVEVARVGIDDELDRARVAVADRRGRGDRRRAHLRPQRRRARRRAAAKASPR